MIARLLALVFTLAALFVPARASAVEIPPAPTRRVTDEAGVLSPAEREDLESRLRAYEEGSGHQVVVWVGRTTGDQPIEDFAVRAFEAWKIGRKGLDDGVVLFVLIDDRKVRIEVGYGLEDRLTDLESARIIRDVIAPSMATGDFDEGVRGGVEAIVDTIEGHADALPAGSGTIRGPPRPAAPQRSWTSSIWMIVLGVGFVILMITHPRLALLLLWSMAGRGGGGGFSGGGGGFSGFGGGGGRSGGGGATGGW